MIKLLKYSEISTDSGQKPSHTLRQVCFSSIMLFKCQTLLLSFSGPSVVRVDVDNITLYRLEFFLKMTLFLDGYCMDFN